MPANKMPEMPEAVAKVAVFDDPREACQNSSVYPSAGEYYTADQMRAMYLAGIEAAKACVPEEEKRHKHDSDLDVFHRHGHNNCRQATLANLTALEQGVGK